jgi:DNA-binding LacI/PurR family transcriptional regulator
MKTVKQTKYAQLAEQFQEQIERGELKPGDRLPSFAEMRARFDASPLTVDRVFSTLEKAGLIVRVQGSGTFVADPQRRVDAAADTLLIGLVVPWVESGFFHEIIRGAEEACQAANCHLVVANSGGNPVLAAKHIETLAARVSGLCIVPGENERYATYSELLEKNVPFVFLDRGLDRLAVSLSTSDNERGGYLATRHLLECGRQQIYVLSEGSASTVAERVRGYRRALTEASVPFEAQLVRHGPLYMDAAGYQLTRDLLAERQAQSRNEPFGIFALNDCIARGSYHAINEAGLNIPEDVAVVGFDDNFAVFLDPPLSTVRQNLIEMGAGAVRLVLENITRGGNVAPRTVRLKPQLVVRNSSDAQSQFCRTRHIMGEPQRT